LPAWIDRTVRSAITTLSEPQQPGSSKRRYWSMIMLHNVNDLTGIIADMEAEGWKLTRELLGGLSPCMREHIRRFGRYLLNMDDMPLPAGLRCGLCSRVGRMHRCLGPLGRSSQQTGLSVSVPSGSRLHTRRITVGRMLADSADQIRMGDPRNGT